MLNDYEIALIVQALYDGDPDHTLDIMQNTSGIDWAIKFYSDCVLFIFEGSHDITDAQRDLDAPMQFVSNFAGVHSGAYIGIRDVIFLAAQYLPKTKKIIVTGHSLGALRAHLATGLLAKLGYTMLETVVYGSPLPGDQELADILAPFPNRSYWNYCGIFKHDFIGDIPPHLPEEPYMHPRQRILIKEPAALPDPWLIFAWHHFKPLYLNGLKKICALSS